MKRAIDIANFFIDWANDADDCMTNLRINKLLYFAQGCYMAKYKKPLFYEDFEAWQYGPVIHSIYDTFTPCGKNRIESTVGDYDPDIFTSDELDFLIAVLNAYGQYSTPKLVDITHEKGSPWDETYKKNGRNSVITKEHIRAYFETLPILETFELGEIDDSEFIGYRDSEGCLVLPAEYDDGYGED